MDKSKYNIAVMGLGYVGLPLAVAFSKKFRVVAYDINETRVKTLEQGRDTTNELSEGELKAAGDICFTSNLELTRECNVYIATVPTPIDKQNKPDLNPLINVSRNIGEVLNKNDVVIFESTVYPGVTEEVCVPEIEKTSNLKYNVDFFVGYSPERINPGDKERTLEKIVKITAGSNEETAAHVDSLYREVIIAGTHMAESIRIAEAAKVIENTQRDVNIALINELAMIFDEMGIDTKAVINAASTKWNFIKLFPGLVGGHCIGVDPYYLTYKAEQLGYKPNLILSSRQINNGMAKFITEKTIKCMIKEGKVVKNSNVLVLGASFKEDCPDIRNSKVFDIVAELNNYDVFVDLYDPIASKAEVLEEYKIDMIENPFGGHKKYDAVIVAVAHNDFKALGETDFENLFRGKSLIIDVKGIMKNSTWSL